MKNQLFIVLSVFVLLSCSPNKVEKDKHDFMYCNFEKHDTIPTNISAFFKNELICDTFYIDILKKTHADSLNEEAHKYFYSKTDYLLYKHTLLNAHGALDGCDTTYHQPTFKEPKYINETAYALGKIKLDDNVNGLLVLFTYKSFSRIESKSDLMLFITRNSILTSGVKLSYWATLPNRESYCMYRTFKTGQKEFVFIGVTDIISFKDSKPKIMKGKNVKYSAFTINNGTIKQVDITDTKISALTDDVSNWKYIESIRPGKY